MEIRYVDGLGIIEGDYRKTKKAHGAAGRRLLMAFVAVLVLLTAFAWLGIQIALASNMFVPN